MDGALIGLETLSYEVCPLDLRRTLRCDVPLLLERTLNVDHEPASFEARCLKSLGRTGRQPTVMPIAISAKLSRCQRDEDSYGTVNYVRPKPNSVDI